MAAIAGNKKRENIHTDIGFVGRKTGFMVQADLARDDNGMEDMSAFFSPTSNAGTLPHIADDDDDDDDSIVGDFEENLEEPGHESDIDIPSDDATRAQNMSGNVGSASMEIEESTARSVTAVLETRKGINTPARRKSMHSTHTTPNLPLSSVTPQSNISTPAIRRPKTKTTLKPPSSQLSKPLARDEETRGPFGSHKENVPNSFDSRQSDEAPVEAPVPRSIPLGARASGLRATGGRGSSMLVAKGLRTARPAITPPPLSDDDDDDDDEPPKFNEESTLDDTEMDVIPAPQPKSKTTQRPAARKENLAESDVPETSSQKPKPGKKGKANVSKTTEEVAAPIASKSDKPATQKRGRKPKATEIIEDTLEAGTSHVGEEGLDTPDAGIPDMEPEELEEAVEAEPSPPKKGKGGRKKKQATTDTEVETEPQPSTADNASQKRKGGRPKKIAEPEPELEEEPTQVDEPEPEPEPEPVTRKTKGRPKKSKKEDTLVPGRDVETQEGPGGELTEQSQPENPTERKKGRKRKAETLVPDTEPETQGSSAITEPTEPSAAKKRKGSKQTVVKPVIEKPRVPNVDPSGEAEGRRSARTRTAPLQFWKNEKVIYKAKERDESGRVVAMSTDVLRVDEEPVAPKRKARPWRPVVVPATERVTKRTTKKKAKEARKAVEESSSESEGGESEDDWEQVGKLVGMVRQWAPDNEDEDREDDEVEDEIATSRHGIEFKPIFGSDYLFAKTLGKPFMGCGILELQTGASKKLKSSGKMQLVFFILKGKVEAEVNELGFRISHGGQFQVPRGNMYKISNPFKKTAKIFFAQACIPDPDAEAE
ncbi:hypothetical protein TWF102_010090 [Orbilia oligospora]|uniref:CENP-C homolog n=1 Tax=Orbilia oligospora TaxID=2813651 RepID=A0A7C8J686_ORBOL|nr:hypothetical protein TWF103_002097 [Orbilia oligospora]KAF3088718.1 hypothetical protein TWF102_010090 [Orbilia oligospora]